MFVLDVALVVALDAYVAEVDMKNAVRGCS